MKQNKKIEKREALLRWAKTFSSDFEEKISKGKFTYKEIRYFYVKEYMPTNYEIYEDYAMEKGFTKQFKDLVYFRQEKENKKDPDKLYHAQELCKEFPDHYKNPELMYIPGNFHINVKLDVITPDGYSITCITEV